MIKVKMTHEIWMWVGASIEETILDDMDHRGRYMIILQQPFMYVE